MSALIKEGAAPVVFTIKEIDPLVYRQQTRRSTWTIALLFVVLALALSTLTVQLFGQSGGDNFYLNLAGVAIALLVTIGLVRGVFWSQHWMAGAVYGWQLKRSLMRITNVMHHIKAGVRVNDPLSCKLLRFYHLGVSQMHLLDGNSSDHMQMLAEIDQHKNTLQTLQLPVEQARFDTAWLGELEKHG